MSRRKQLSQAEEGVISSFLRRVYRSKPHLIVSGATVLISVGFIYNSSHNKMLLKNMNEQIESDTINPKKSSRGNLDATFFKQVKELIRIVIPSSTSNEAIMLYAHTLFLISRTFMSIYVAQLDGRIVSSLVSQSGSNFLFYVSLWLLVGIPASFINSMIKFLECKLSLNFRKRLVNHCYDMYMDDDAYYKVQNLDSRLSNADQSLTEDISKFCTFLGHLYSQLSKPILDVTLITLQLIVQASKKTGNSKASLAPAAVCFLIVSSTAKVLKLAQPPFGKIVAAEAKMEGDLRYVHGRLITNSEEIAFYHGNEIETNILKEAFHKLIDQKNLLYRVRIFYNTIEDLFMKYVWSATGLVMVAIPSFFYEEASNLTGGDAITSRTEEYITVKKLLLSGSEAIERIMLAYKDITELAGYTSRVHEMITVYKDIKEKKYMKNTNETCRERLMNRGQVHDSSNFVSFLDVPIMTPNGDVLIEKLNFTIRSGMHCLITGPNGCGKSSLFRILGGLWPVYGGSLYKPHYTDMFYIPQRPYMCIGCFRDQIIYPDTQEKMLEKGITDDDLFEILQVVALDHILEREKSFDSNKNWMDVLSGGEKQRLGMARLFYHKPRFAILDECTSAVSIDVEGKMYTHAIESGITLLTVTHRPSLWPYHKFLLQFDGQGNYTFKEMDAKERQSQRELKQELLQKLKEVNRQLGEDENDVEEDF
eukprot:TRINITY_DN12998_c0_g1_i1.p1 TRINITY_DN12998_c0_g1~~TRINITY_DN12998_c0_g1_i1.p1  ORF type:complete len:706 (-),score=131.34 TRINITY_DN12998_c0_g1_i1:1041-3158(-)